MVLLQILAVLCGQPAAFAELELVGEKGVLLSGDKGDWDVNLDGSMRLSYNTLAHVVSLNYDKKNDFQNYMGEQYSLGLDVKYKKEYEGYIKFASFGAARYDAPIYPERPVHTIYGDVGSYSGTDLLPRLQEWWLSSPLVPDNKVKAKAGLFKYSVGSGLALGGYYENYGANMSVETGILKWTSHFAAPDLENKWYVGPKVADETGVFGVKYNSRAYFFAEDVTVSLGEGSFFQPYLGILIDDTPAAKRNSAYLTPVSTEYLGTYGADYEITVGELSLGAEAAANFGKAWSDDPSYPDISHEGWMFNAGAAYSLFDGKVKPRTRVYYLSGNKYVGDDITDGQVVKGVNRDFSVYSPLNNNLADTFYPAFNKGPYVFAGMGNSLDQGILRPGAFRDPYQMTNLIAPNVGIDLNPIDNLTLRLDYWYLRSAEPGIGADYDPVSATYSPYTLPTYLGNELDAYAEYSVTDNIVLSFLAGLFLPGDYYRKNRGDEDLLGVSSAPRFDGNASNAWMLEAAVTYSF